MVNEKIGYNNYGRPQARHFWGPYRARQPWEPHPFDIFQHHSNNLRRIFEGIFPPIFTQHLRGPGRPGGWYPPFRPPTQQIRPPGEFPIIIPDGAGGIEPSLEIIIEPLPLPGHNQFPGIGNIPIGPIPVGPPEILLPIPDTEMRPPIEPIPVPEPPSIQPSPELSVIPLPMRPVQPIVQQPVQPIVTMPTQPPVTIVAQAPMMPEVPAGNPVSVSTETTIAISSVSSSEAPVTQPTTSIPETTTAATSKAPAIKSTELDKPIADSVPDIKPLDDPEKAVEATVSEVMPVEDKSITENAPATSEMTIAIASSESDVTNGADEPASSSENTIVETVELSESQPNADEAVQSDSELESPVETESPSEEQEETTTIHTEVDDMETNQVR